MKKKLFYTGWYTFQKTKIIQKKIYKQLSNDFQQKTKSRRQTLVKIFLEIIFFKRILSSVHNVIHFRSMASPLDDILFIKNDLCVAFEYSMDFKHK